MSFTTILMRLQRLAGEEDGEVVAAASGGAGSGRPGWGWGGGGSGLWRGGIVAAGAGGLPGRCPRPRGPAASGVPHHRDAPPLVAAGPAAGWSIPVAPARAPRVGRSCFYRGGREGPDTPGSSLLPQWEDHR